VRRSSKNKKLINLLPAGQRYSKRRLSRKRRIGRSGRKGEKR
jgi:hypothetical protein